MPRKKKPAPEPVNYADVNKQCCCGHPMWVHSKDGCPSCACTAPGTYDEDGLSIRTLRELCDQGKKSWQHAAAA